MAGATLGTGLTLWLLVANPFVSPWDGLWVMGWVSGGAITVAWPTSWRPIPRAGRVILAVATTVALLVGELVVRGFMSPPQSLHPAGDARLSWSKESLEGSCDALFPARYGPLGSHFRAPDASEESQRLVLHVGDSMVLGTGLDLTKEAPFPTLLNRRYPGERHVNAGTGGVGPDYYLALIRRWVETERRPDLLVVHLFAGNDVTDMDRPYRCCDFGPLLDDSGASSCPTAVWRHPAWAVLARAPSPYVLRVTGTASALARTADFAWTVWARAMFTETLTPNEGADGRSDQWTKLELVLTALRDEMDRSGIPLLVSVLPDRQALEASEPRASVGYGISSRLVSTARRLGITTVDAWPLLERLLAEKPGPHWFAEEVPLDVHLGQAGHERYAAWLADHLAAQPEQ